MPEVKIGKLGPNREPYKRRKIPGTGAPHEEGWMSAGCKRGNHAGCFARQCGCACHPNLNQNLSTMIKFR